MLKRRIIHKVTNEGGVSIYVILTRGLITVIYVQSREGLDLEESLMNDGFQFRQLLDKHGLVELAGGESDALDWLESQVK